MTSARRLNDLPSESWSPVLEAARALFTARNRFGVFAFGIGPRIRRGRRRKELTLNAYVLRKVESPRVPVPPVRFAIKGQTWEVLPNVIATGRRARAAAGGSPAYSGVHPGAVVTVRGSTPGRGALACLLGAVGAPTHALTAGHVFPDGSIGASVFAAASAGSPEQAIGTVVANFLDSEQADGAVIELSSAGQSLVTSAGPPLSDFVAERSAFGKVCRAFLATTNDFSRETETEPKAMDALLGAPTRGSFWVRGAIPTDGEITNEGDSGTVLCTGATSSLAVGVCAGALGAHSIFEPIARLLDLARQQVNATLEII